MSCSILHRCGLNPALLWLWCRPTAAAPIRPLAWELPYASGAALKSKKKNGNGRQGWQLWEEVGLDQWFSTRGDSSPQGTCANIWDIFGCHQKWEGMLLASSEKTTGMVLNNLLYKGQHQGTKNPPAPNVSGAKAGEAWDGSRDITT